MPTKTLDYYGLGPVLSRNAVFNFVVGARGVGKTYSAKVWGVRDYLNNGNQFIYLRRYATELKSATQTLFADIAQEFPDYMFRCHGDILQMKRGDNKDDKWEIIGYAIALSKAQQKKSVAYPRVTKIIYDEFIIDRGAIRYMPDEAKAFNDFYSTVDRYKDKTRVLFLANSVSIMNPYFIEYEIRPRKGQEWVTKANGFICVHFPKSEKFTQGVYETRFGKFIKGTEYAQYAVGNDFSDNDDSLIARKTSESKYTCTIETVTGVFSLWIDYSGPHYYIQHRRPKQEFYWTLIPDRVNEDRILVDKTDPFLTRLRGAYARGRVFFDAPQSRNAFIGVFKR